MKSQLPLLPLLLDNVPPGLTRALAQEGVPFRHRAEHRLAGRFVLFDSRSRPCRPLAMGQTAIDVDALRHGEDGDPFEALLDERAARHRWNVHGVVISEEIACVDRRPVRRRLMAKLRAQIENAGGVWVCLSPYPFPHRSAMNFRIDHDRHDPRDFDVVMEAIAGNERATTHFVNAAAYLPHEEAVRRFEGLDVGSHGFHHHTYRTGPENLSNIRRGIESLRSLGIEPYGFAAPGGRFHRGLLAALETLRIPYSSEFGLAYDDLPFFPEGNSVLQVPIHPICLGIFLETVQGEGARRNSATQQAVSAAIDHFRQTARAKYNSGEPVFFYGHPSGRLGRFPQVLRAVFDTVDAFGAVWKTTLREFAAWWRLRDRVRLKVIQRGSQYVVRAVHSPKDYALAVEYWRGDHLARMPLEGRELRFSPGALAYENRNYQPYVAAVRDDRPYGLRAHILRMIDWEKETPVDEIAGGDWKHWVKRTLRRWRA